MIQVIQTLILISVYATVPFIVGPSQPFSVFLYGIYCILLILTVNVLDMDNTKWSPLTAGILMVIAGLLIFQTVYSSPTLEGVYTAEQYAFGMFILSTIILAGLCAISAVIILIVLFMVWVIICMARRKIVSPKAIKKELGYGKRNDSL